MAVLSDTDRATVWAEFMRTFPPGETCTIVKADLRAAVNAVDQWVSDNASAFNTALPLPARTSLTASQKARLLEWVVNRRYLVGV